MAAPLDLVRLPVKLHITGPVVTAGSTFAAWGVDVTFYRNWEGKYAIPGSHVRGKLKEAMALLQPHLTHCPMNVEKWFGKESGDSNGKYEPIRGRLKITDFVLVDRENGYRENIINKIRINPERLCVDKGALVMMESPVGPNQKSVWEGYVEFFCKSDEKNDCLEELKKAFLFITNIGGEKTTGWGRLTKVVFGDPIGMICARAYAISGFKIAIRPHEPLFIGGIRRSENVFESDFIIPGAVLKGALATGLNRLAGNTDLNSPITSDNEKVKKLFPSLANNFSDIIFLHAIPSETPFVRPETIPLSGVTYDGKYQEITFKNDEEIYSEGVSPVTFQIDWKGMPENLPEIYHLPPLEFHPVTRTAIDPETRKADDSKLYSMHMIKPKTGPPDCSRQIYWNTEVRFPSSLLTADRNSDRSSIISELRKALPLALRYLGKRQSIVDVEVANLNAQEDFTLAREFAIVLQTPTITINPEDAAKNANTIFDDSSQLGKQYENYWQGILGGGVKMKRFFAAQELRGGYLGMRFKKAAYRPFYLTSAGSTFVFELCGGDNDKEKTKQKVVELLRNGLPLPKWAEEYYGDPAWKFCPFVRENGYGEIKIKTKEI